MQGLGKQAKRYGFIHVNRDEHDLLDLARTKKDSFHWYRTVIDINGAHLTPHQPTPPATENQT